MEIICENKIVWWNFINAMIGNMDKETTNSISARDPTVCLSVLAFEMRFGNKQIKCAI